MRCEIDASNNLVISPENKIEVYALSHWRVGQMMDNISICELNKQDDLVDYMVKKEDIKPTPVKKPPLGIKPKWVHDQERSNDLVEAIERYLSKGIVIPLKWIEEYNEFFK